MQTTILRRHLGGSVWLLLAGCLGAAERSAYVTTGVQIETYGGWTNCLSLKCENRQVRSVIVPTVGGRIMHYSLNGENLLHETAAALGQTLDKTPDGFWAGGYQCDVGPEIRGIPDHKTLWLGAYHWKAPDDYRVVLSSEPDKTLGVALEKEILMDPETGDLGITQRMKNTSDQETSFCIWDRTLCRGGGFAIFPLNKKSRFPARWSIRRKVGEQYSYDGALPVSPQVQILDGMLVAQSRGEPTRVGADSDAGWIAYVRGRVLFVKYFSYAREGNYTDGGNSVELYFDQQVAEFGPVSPEARLKPTENYSFPEKWTLIALKKEVTSFKEARALASKVPASPFKR